MVGVLAAAIVAALAGAAVGGGVGHYMTKKGAEAGSSDIYIDEADVDANGGSTSWLWIIVAVVLVIGFIWFAKRQGWF